jgi:glucosyl-3-phosphoglycerate phosphatase
VRIVHFVRHGESEFNRRWTETGTDPLIRDAPLSTLGQEQVRATRANALALVPDLVITSPLTRALQTADGLFGGTSVSVVVDALHREKVTNSDDVGSSPSTLRTRFPHLDFDHLEEHWWHRGPVDELGVPIEPDQTVDERVAAFRLALSQLPEQRIVVVGHGDFFRRLVGYRLANCEIVRFDASSSYTDVTRHPEGATSLARA